MFKKVHNPYSMKKLAILLVFLSNYFILFSQTTEIHQFEAGISAYRGQKSERINKKIEVKSNAVKANLSEDFESSIFPPKGWTIVDSDNDGYNFIPYLLGSTHSGNISAASGSWTNNTILTPNNHLITPGLIPSVGDSLSFWYAAQDPDYPSDKFQVIVSTTGKYINDFTDTLWIKTISDTTWTEKKISLASYVDDTIYISFNHFDCSDWFFMKLDDISGPAMCFPNDISISDISNPNSSCALNTEDVSVEIENKSDLSVTGFSLAFKVDSGNYITENYNGLPIPAFGKATYTFTTKANLSVVGNHIITAKIFYPNDSDSMNNIATKKVEHYLPKTIPYAIGFEAGESLNGWIIKDIAGDEDTWYSIVNGVNPYGGTGYMYCTTPCTNDWLISPCLDLQSGVQYEVSAWIKTIAGANEHLTIMLGQSPTPAGLTTHLSDVAIYLNYYFQIKKSFTVPSDGLYYIGIHANSTSSLANIYLDDFMVDDLVSEISEVEKEISINIFPNPADNSFKILSTENIFQVKITNLLAQEIKTVIPNSKEVSINIADLDEGLYLIKIEASSGTITQKLVIKR
jgi:hypothetical protein